MPEKYFFPDAGQTAEDVTYTYISGSPQPDNIPGIADNKIYKGYYSGSNSHAYFRLRKENALLPQNPYTRFDCTENRSTGSYGGTYESASKSYKYHKDSHRTVVGGLTTVTEARGACEDMRGFANSTALIQAALADCSPPFDLGTTSAELNSTVRMIIGAHKRFKGLAKQAFEGGYATAKALASARLEWRYGWETLGFDIQAITDLYNEPFKKQIVTGQAGASTHIDGTEPTRSFSGYYASYDEVTEWIRALSVRASAAVKFRAKSPNVLVSAKTTAWELIPLSFVADWFVSVGDAIGAWEVITSSQDFNISMNYYLDEYRTTKIDSVSAGTGTYSKDPFASGSSSMSSSFKERIPVYYMPSLVPQIRTKLNTSRHLDAIALLTNRLPTKPPPSGSGPRPTYFRRR